MIQYRAPTKHYYCSIIIFYLNGLTLDATICINMDLSGATVAITGISGFLASELCAQLLSRGIRVHGTVRSLADPTRTEHLRSLPGAADLLTLFEADLISNVGGFASSFEGCAVVFHTACPFHVMGKAEALGEEFFVGPAVEGTVAVLQAVRTVGSATRVVLTSSTAAIFKRIVEVII
jgi:nucleoside-diphosphate-sugar epimerase